MFKRVLVILVLFALVGCADEPVSSAMAAKEPEAKSDAQPSQNENAKAETNFTHVIATETAYYKGGPQQAQPPDGRFRAGTKVKLIEEAGSYILVRSEDGITAYVVANSVKKIEKPTAPEAADLSSVIEGNNEFALDLYAKLRSEEAGNLFFSPNSISTALAMTYAGARGDTEEEMGEVLHFTLPQAKLHPSFAALTGKLQGEKAKGYQLRIANRLWGQKGYQFLPEFLGITRDQYGAELALVDYVEKTEEARKTINVWVEEQTKQKITDLIQQGVLNQMTRLVLTNAIYFKGNWASQFNEEATKDAPFRVIADETVNVQMMYQKDKFKYGAIERVKVLELPYESGDLSMLILLPEKAGGLAELEKSLTTDRLAKWASAARKQEVNVCLPKFTMTSQFGLKDVLTSMGMPLAFTPEEADFSGMNGKRDLFISAVIHKAFVEVNEEGTEAAAATGVAVGVTSVQITPTFRANHPFVLLIRDNRTGSILFMGRVMNPKATDGE
jgi:serpin B